MKVLVPVISFILSPPVTPAPVTDMPMCKSEVSFPVKVIMVSYPVAGAVAGVPVVILPIKVKNLTLKFNVSELTAAIGVFDVTFIGGVSDFIVTPVTTPVPVTAMPTCNDEASAIVRVASYPVADAAPAPILPVAETRRGRDPRFNAETT